jgi:cbb3-type cytochrome c oxidase subunit III
MITVQQAVTSDMQRYMRIKRKIIGHFCRREFQTHRFLSVLKVSALTRPFVLLTVFWAGGATYAAAQSATESSVLNGAFTEEQAVRGQALYYQHCLQCHGETLAGVDKAPPLAGPQFGSTWNHAPLAALVTRIQTMPPDKPALLAVAESVDILTYILWYNGLPLGQQPLDTSQEVLTHMTFEMPAQ